MRLVICSISLLLGSIVLTACGQSGALQLPSDPKHDKRAKYLLYKNEAHKTVAASEVKAEDQASSSIPQTQTTSP